MKRLALAALLLIPSPALAVTYYYNIDTGSDANAGTNPAAPRKTIANANNRAAGSVIILQASTATYDTHISPVNTNVTFIGDSTNARNVNVPGVYLKVASGSTHIDNIVVNGVHILGGVHIEAIPTFGYADGFHLRNSTVDCEVFVSEANARFERDTIGTGLRGSHFRVFCDLKASQATVVDCVMNLRPGSLTDWTSSYYLFGLSAVSHLRPRQYDVLTNNKITITLPANCNYEKLTFLRGIQYMQSSRNKWYFRDSSGVSPGGTLAQGLLFRDFYRYNRSLNDTILFETQIAGKGGLYAQMPGPGSTNQGFDNTCYQNTWAFMLMKSNVPREHAPFGATWQLGNGDSLYQSVIACSTGIANTGYFVNNAVGTSYVLRNTFFNFGGGGGVRFGTTSTGSDCAYWTGTVNFRGNICYTRSTGTGVNDYGAAMFWQSGGTGIDADYNLYAHYGGGGSRAVLGGTCGQAGQVYAVGPTSTLCATLANDCNSLVGRPLFADSSWANFNYALTAGSAAVGGYLGANIGAWDGTPAGSDVTPPAAISDLTSTGVGTDVATFSWLAPGDDGGSGTATSYQVRYASVPLTDANFASTGTAVSNVAAPSAAGSRDYVVIPSLTPSTTYYVAIKTTDSDANVSSVSNVVQVTTLAVSGRDRFSDE